MAARRPGVSAATTLVILAGIVSAVGVLILVVRVAARERERSERASTSERTARTELETARHAQRESDQANARLREERTRRERVVEQEILRVRGELAAATEERDRLHETYRAAAAERDRGIEDLRAARRDLEAARNDHARLAGRTREAEGALVDRTARLQEAVEKVADLESRMRPVLRLLVRDLRSPEASLRVRAIEALNRYFGKEFPYRPDGSPEERETDALAIEKELFRAGSPAR
jgi:chromosome segregation ATPase